MRVTLLVVTVLIFLPAEASWWNAGSQVTDPEFVCRKAKKLRGRIGKVCRGDPGLLLKIKEGVQLGTQECQDQFKKRRWNCTNNKKSLRKVLLRDTRETAFVNAITAAGVTYAVTRACTMGQLVECSCDKSTTKGAERPRARDRTGPAVMPWEVKNWVWGGCSDNIAFGYKKSKAFMDYPYRKRSDMKTLVRLHNNDAGRIAVRNHMRTACLCHGMSGSCTLQTCWRKMPPFREVGNRLKDAFDGASRVIPSNDGRSFIPDGQGLKPPGRGDLVYAEGSFDFCTFNRKSGSLGTQGRECNSTSPGLEGCELLCCGRGYDTRILRETSNCCVLKNHFNVTCEKRLKERTVYICR